MRLSQLQKISQSSFSLLQAKLQQDSKRKRIDQRNDIKINRRKLPSDFFKGTVDKSLNKRSLLDPQFGKSPKQKSLFLFRQPQTQRKIQSYQCLPSKQLDPPIDYGHQAGSQIKMKEQHLNLLHRKIYQKQIEDIQAKQKLRRLDKSIDCVKIKCLKQKQSQQKIIKISNFQTSIKKKNIDSLNDTKEQKQPLEFDKFMDMACTFGRGFTNKVNFSLQNSIVLKQNDQSPAQFIEEEVVRDKKNLSGNKKYGYEKSTEQSQFFDSLKSKQNSPVRKRVAKPTSQTEILDNPKTSSTQKHINFQETFYFKNIEIQNSKHVHTAQEKQRKIRNRANSSSTEQRSVRIRKDKKIEEINLPTIRKKTSFKIEANN